VFAVLATSGSIITPVDGGRRPEPIRGTPDEEAQKPLANTFLKVVCGDTAAEATVGGYGNTAARSPQSMNPQKYVRLPRVDPQVPAVCLKVIPETGGVTARGQLLRLPAKRPVAGRAVSGKAVSHQPQGGL
jgi:hypothetical protein